MVFRQEMRDRGPNCDSWHALEEPVWQHSHRNGLNIPRGEKVQSMFYNDLILCLWAKKRCIGSGVNLYVKIKLKQAVFRIKIICTYHDDRVADSD
jgi:hypothetical protein